MSLTFEPWIGDKYHDERLGGLKLLILGESHYGKEGEETKVFTRQVVRSLGQEHRHKFFTTTAKLVLGLGSGYISNSKRADFWDRVAFSNYIQTFVAEEAEGRARPTKAMWEEAQAALPLTIEKTSPDAMLVLGLDIEKRLPEFPSSLPCHAVQHPSQYFSYAKWQPGVQRFLASVRSAA